MLLLMFRILYKCWYSYDIDDFGISSNDVLPSASPSNVGPSMMRATSVHNESTSPPNVGPSMMRLASLHNEIDYDDFDENDYVM